MAFALINYTHAEGLNTVTTPAVDMTLANLIVYCVVYYTAGGTPSLSFSDSSGNTSYTNVANFVSSITDLHAYAKYNPAVSAAMTFTSTRNLSGDIYQTLTVAGFSGAASAVVDVLATGDVASAASINVTGSSTPTQDNCLAMTMAGVVDGNATSFACDFGATQNIVQPVNGDHVGGGMCWTIQTTATGFDPTWSWSSVNSEAVMARLAFQAAPTGPGPAMGGRFHRIVTRPAAFRPGIAR